MYPMLLCIYLIKIVSRTVGHFNLADHLVSYSDYFRRSEHHLLKNIAGHTNDEPVRWNRNVVSLHVKMHVRAKLIAQQVLETPAQGVIALRSQFPVYTGVVTNGELERFFLGWTAVVHIVWIFNVPAY